MATKKTLFSSSEVTPELQPIRSEIFGMDRFAQHARSLAEAQKNARVRRSRRSLLPRLEENAQVLRECYRRINSWAERKIPIVPAAEWLIDSFFVVEDQIRDVKRDLPPGFYDELPKLPDGFLKDYPRVFGLAWAFVAHTDSRFDGETLLQFVTAYQEVDPLTSGELWAVAITIRLVLLENLRRCALQIARSQLAREEADTLADSILGLAEGTTQELDADALLKKTPDPRAFLVQLSQRFHYHDPLSTPVVQWLNDVLLADGLTQQAIASALYQDQAAANLTVRNIITSFRSMVSHDWKDFFERVSLVHAILCADPTFARMDFLSRDDYRHAVEALAKGSGRNELEIARTAAAHAGKNLFGHGRLEFEAQIGYRPQLRERLRRAYSSKPTASFFLSLLVALFAMLALPIALSNDPRHFTGAPLVLLLLAFLPATDLAVALVNRAVVELIGPKRMPRLELLNGPPEDLRTFVVIPTLLGNSDSVLEQVERLEIHFLANPDGFAYFALLTDWSDADVETRPEDASPYETAAEAVARLNATHGPAPDGSPRFFLFHRRRQWNASQRKWMGWERKRGKLQEFNRLLRGATDTSYVLPPGTEARIPRGVKYVITLDSDTRLPQGAVKQLVGTLAHPFHHAHFSPQERRVNEGYGILQPRVTSSFPGRGEASIFQRLFSGECGVDPYAFAVSDVYQDLFGEGSFTGKGIYDVDAFEHALEGRVPDNSLLSHDLFEGSFARAGLISDVEFFEEFPAHVGVALSRTHRWIRGDWQLLPWIFGGRTRSQGLTTISRWKMIDNLRRSLSPVAVIALIIVAFMAPTAERSVWLAFALLCLAVPPFIPFLSDLVPRRRIFVWADHLRATRRDFRLGLSHLVVNLSLLPTVAWMHLDAIVRTLWRMGVSRRNLLEWMTAAQTKSSASLSLAAFFRSMRASVGVGAFVLALLAWKTPDALSVALPFCALWLGAPAFARWISLPTPQDEDERHPLTLEESAELRLHARRIWRFFTTFVTAEDHFLPPDNFQEDPAPVLAHRSSPTNFGLYLLATIAAHDFGWCGLREMTERLEDTLRSMDRLPRFRGHFFNWYETRDLRVLPPNYVSSVDSGNLAGHLITLAQACAELSGRPVIFESAIQGIQDDLRLFQRALEETDDDRRTSQVSRDQLVESAQKLEERLIRQPASFGERAEYWDALELRGETLFDTATAYVQERGDLRGNEIAAWAERLVSDIRSQARDFRTLVPWAPLLSRHNQVGDDSAIERKLWHAIDELLGLEVPLRDLPARCLKAIEHLDVLRGLGVGDNERPRYALYFDQLVAALQASAEACLEAQRRLDKISGDARRLFNEMDFSFLLNQKKNLLSIGYRAESGELDESCYDLLASEARLTSYVAIIKGDVPVSHWFHLGRSLAPVEGGAALVSWSGSMFEYLMPSLVMTNPTGSLLEQTCRLIVRHQIAYGEARTVPWGISESAYNVRDIEFTYQYSNFGVPGLGLKRGLSHDLVIAPYASMLASMIDPRSALRNLRRLEAAGLRGPFGFYESVDFTPSRVREGQSGAIVRAYMAHHQGMALVALANVLHHGKMRKRFSREPLVQSAELLLQERTPRNLGNARYQMQESQLPNVRDVAPPILRRFSSPSHPIPSSHLLSNGDYSVMITAAGSGYSRWGGLGITRWREDVTLDARGSFIYVRDIGSGSVWSATYQPACVEADHYEAVFSEDRARITRTDESLRSELEVLVSSEDDAELRRFSLTNTGSEARELEITSYLEVVLAPPDADRAHPAFSNLFIQTEYLHDERALLATRRPRSANEHRNYLALALATDLETLGGTEYETDRSKFIGRNRDLASPVSVMDGRPLSNTVGSVLDPILSLRTRIRVLPGTTVRLLFTTIASPEREKLVELIEKYRSPGAFERTSSLVWTHSQARLYHLGIDPAEALVFQRLANRVLFSDPLLRPSSETLKRNRLNIQGLWGRGISGDLPIVLVRVDDGDDQSLVRQLLRAHEYWRFKGLAVDIVILNEKGSSYAQDFQNSLEGLARASESSSGEGGRHGRVYVLRYDLLDPRERELLHAVARAVINSREGSLAEQVGRTRNSPSLLDSPMTDGESPPPGPAPLLPTLEFFNGLGGFSTDGREYVTVLEKDMRTPAPWINVVANEQLGFHVSESGSGYTWSLNSRENQLTPWSNDPVSDPAGEAFYFRDLEDNAIWSGSASPIRIGGAVYIARHGMGYSVFETGIAEIQSEVAQFVGGKDPIKVSRIRLTNRSSRPRKIEVTAYVEWVLGFSRSQTAHSIVVERDSGTAALFAINPLNSESGRRVAFLDLGGRQSSFTASRTEFIGRNGSLARPAALRTREPLGGASGAGLDPCGVVRTEVTLRPGESVEIPCFLGQAEDAESAKRLILEWRKKNLESELRAVRSEWAQFLDTVQVATPDRSLDVLLNAWLPYQTYVCRFLARAAFYQAGGAYGFRDQLQDVAALATAQPQIAREHILRAASRQFVEGDVQHWWHPPTGRGVRTHFSDDLLWLPFVVLRYLKITGDQALLNERVPYIQGPLLDPAKEDAYFEPTVAPPQAEESIFEHCARTLDRSLRVGVHGLPLMGTGDWNDGMNRVGHEGRGESVWVGWFLYTILNEMAPVAAARGESLRAETWLTHAQRLKTALETEAWDGEWYRRAFFDDGTPLGSSANAECRIDSIAQTWAVLSGGADPSRATQAMSSVERHLVRAQDDLILLFSPPFDRTDKDPGYIKGYLPGVRENGGQYSHAAVWCVCAYAKLGNGNRAHELFSMLNPINHGSTRTDIQCYKVEPYVMAADIYGESPHIGRGGWTWYTGSSGWMYRAGIEFILGLRKEGENLIIDPCIPEHWPGFQAVFRHSEAVYEIQITNPHHLSHGIARLLLDGQMLDPVKGVPLSPAAGRHRVVATLGTITP